MSWPLPHDYNEAVQVPGMAFADPDLKTGQAAAGASGLPLPRSGNFADVYQIHGADGRSWAAKCFTRPVAGLDHRYLAIAAALAKADFPFAVGFTFLNEGIRVAGRWMPAVKMEWVEGLLVNQFVRENADKPAALDGLLRMWARLCKRLREAGIAHADLQHGNVLLVPGAKAGSVGLKLIDYDGMYVPALANNPSGEAGHAGYQHPARVATRAYSPDLDRFPHLVVAAALAGLKVLGPALWDRYDTGDNLLFSEADFQNPAASRVMKDIWLTGDPAAQALVGNLALACRRPMPQTPWLDQIAPDGKPIPLPPDWLRAAATALGFAPAPPAPAPPVPVPPRAFDLDDTAPPPPKRALPFNPIAVAAAVLLVGAAVGALVVFGGGDKDKSALNTPKDDAPKDDDKAVVPPPVTPEPPKPEPEPEPEPKKPEPEPKKVEPPIPDPPKPPDAVPEVIPPPRLVERRPVPAAAAQATATAEVRAVLKDDYARKAPGDKKVLAKRLLGLAEGTTDDPPARYVMLRNARDLAVEAADPATAAQAVDWLARWFVVDADGLKAAALEQILAAATAPAALRAVAEVALPASDAAHEADEYDAAIRFADLAVRAAKKGTLGLAAVEDGDYRVAQAKKAQEAFAAVKPAADALKTNPDDPAANLALGKYRCFAQARWDDGLKLLAKGADPVLRAAADLDLAETRTGVADVKVGDAWWGYAQAAPDAEKRAAEARARFWYGRAVGGLTGLAKATAEGRMGFAVNATEYRPGLLAEFTTRSPTAPKLTKARIEPGVEFSNLEFADLPKKGTDVTAKWTGVLVPPRPGRYKLVVVTTEPVKVAVGGKTVIDTITAKSARKDATVTLPDRPTLIVVELHTVPTARNDVRRLKLGWQLAGAAADDVIPPEYLFHDRKAESVIAP